MSEQGKQQLQPTTKDKIQAVHQLLMARREEIARIVGDSQQTERLLMSAVIEAANNPQLQGCTPASVVRAVMQAAILRLDLASGLGEAYLVPFAEVCTLIPGYRGFQKKAQEAGYNIICDVVYSKDRFLFAKAPPRVEHEPCLDDDRGEFLGVYAVAYGAAGQIVKSEWCPPEQIAQAQKMSRSPAWKAWPDRMARKLAIKRLCKDLPNSDGLAKLATIDDKAENGGGPDPEIDRSPEAILEAMRPAEPLEEGTARFRKRQTTTAPEPWIATMRQKMFAWFGELGITEAQVLARVGKASASDIGADELAALRGIGNALKAGEIDAAQAFPAAELPEGRGKKKKKAAETADEPAEEKSDDFGF